MKKGTRPHLRLLAKSAALLTTRLSRLALLSGLLAGAAPARAQQTLPVDFTVQATAETTAQGVTLQWPQGRFVTGYTVERKQGSQWQTLGSLPATATSFTDATAPAPTGVEYRITKTTSRGFPGYGYIRAGWMASNPAHEQRGVLILVADNTHAAALAAELNLLESDLAGDGWTVRRLDVSPGDSVASVRAAIQGVYQTDPANTKAVFLFGHVPVPYSGNIAPDSHENHQGAWPADGYYGDMDGAWTDVSVNSIGAERAANRNVPGDGKFDQNEPPGGVELAVGRVDFWQMTTYANKTPSRSERDLLRAYLAKNHAWRHAQMTVPNRALIADFFQDKGDDPVGNSGWRNFSPIVGPGQIEEAGVNEYFPTTSERSFLWSYAAGGGSSYTLSAGIGTSDDFSTRNTQVIFGLFTGSYFGDWNNESNFLRASLGSGSILAAAFAGFPHWILHPMALGETIGACAVLTQNNRPGGLYPPYNLGAGQVHISLLGDPTLRLNPVKPPASFTASATGSTVRFAWQGSPDSDLLEHVLYRGASRRGPFQRIASGASLPETDQPGSGSHVYLLRAVKRQQTPSGSYLNYSQGLFAEATVSGGSATPLRLGINRAATALQLSGPAGARVVIESSSDLISWTPRATNQLSGGSAEIPAPMVPRSTRQYYRGRVAP